MNNFWELQICITAEGAQVVTSLFSALIRISVWNFVGRHELKCTLELCHYVDVSYHVVPKRQSFTNTPRITLLTSHTKRGNERHVATHSRHRRWPLWDRKTWPIMIHWLLYSAFHMLPVYWTHHLQDAWFPFPRAAQSAPTRNMTGQCACLLQCR